MLSDTAVRSAGLQSLQEGVLAVSRIPIYRNNLSGCHDGWPADRIAANVLAPTPDACRLYRKYFGVQKSGSGRMARPKRRKRKGRVSHDLPGYDNVTAVIDERIQTNRFTLSRH